MKESLYIDIFSKTGTMNLEDGMQKNQCWNAIYQHLGEKFLRKFKDNAQISVLRTCFVFIEIISTGHILIYVYQETLELELC